MTFVNRSSNSLSPLFTLFLLSYEYSSLSLSNNTTRFIPKIHHPQALQRKDHGIAFMNSCQRSLDKDGSYLHALQSPRTMDCWVLLIIFPKLRRFLSTCPSCFKLSSKSNLSKGSNKDFNFSQSLSRKLRYDRKMHINSSISLSTSTWRNLCFLQIKRVMNQFPRLMQFIFSSSQKDLFSRLLDLL